MKHSCQCAPLLPTASPAQCLLCVGTRLLNRASKAGPFCPHATLAGCPREQDSVPLTPLLGCSYCLPCRRVNLSDCRAMCNKMYGFVVGFVSACSNADGLSPHAASCCMSACQCSVLLHRRCLLSCWNLIVYQTQPPRLKRQDSAKPAVIACPCCCRASLLLEVSC